MEGDHLFFGTSHGTSLKRDSEAGRGSISFSSSLTSVYPASTPWANPGLSCLLG